MKEKHCPVCDAVMCEIDARDSRRGMSPVYICPADIAETYIDERGFTRVVDNPKHAISNRVWSWYDLDEFKTASAKQKRHIIRGDGL